jgi:peptidoglycan/LPS O-acetylase OafA/YrhL
VLVTRQRIEALDVLRGVAALSVVLWHWQHFFPLDGVPSAMPLYWLLRPFYEAGHWGVDLFFCISGFVFFLLYAEKIASDGVTPLRFFVLRVSRLYPLHFATLLTVVVLQHIYLTEHQHYFVYDDNSWSQFILHLLMLSNWFPNDLTFNGPAWSLSVEALLYVSFYIVCRMRSTHPAFIACMSIAGLLLWKWDSQIGRGFLAFYLGCLSAMVVGQIQATRTVSLPVVISALAVVVIALLAVYASNNLTVAETAARVVAFPGLVMAAALFDRKIGAVTRRLQWLGDISYSSYLLHFPLQLTLAASGLKINYASPNTLLGFLAMLVAISLASFHWFERPVMNAVRSRVVSIRPPAAT